MLTPDQMQTLETAAQDILYQEPFDDIRPSIDGIANAAADDTLGRLRVRKLPVGGAFVHAVGSRVIETIEQHPQPGQVGDSGQATYDHYQALTNGIERAVGQEVVAELKDKEGTFQDSFKYFDDQMDILWETEKANADHHNRLGKITKGEPPTSEELLSGLLAGNGIDVSTSLILRQVMQLCREEGRLPSSEELGDYLRKKLDTLGGLVHAPGQVFHRSILGKELANKHFRRIRYENNAELSSTAWSKLFRKCLETGSRPPLTQEMAPSLQEHPPAPFQLFGYCIAQLKLRPLERPGRPETARLAVASFFGRQGVTLRDGSFRLSDYQLLRNIEVAQDTILADNDCRAALELLARDDT